MVRYSPVQTSIQFNQPIIHKAKLMSNDSQDLKLYERIYLVVQQIPARQVATYGQIAAIVGRGCTARMVGYAMSALKVDDVITPWQRVINRQGKISPRTDGEGNLLQRALLEAEGVCFDSQQQIDFQLIRIFNFFCLEFLPTNHAVDFKQRFV